MPRVCRILNFCEPLTQSSQNQEITSGPSLIEVSVHSARGLECVQASVVEVATEECVGEGLRARVVFG